MPYYATCSTDERVQVVGPFDDIIEATQFGFDWSVSNDHENRWHVLFCKNGECIVELLNPVQATERLKPKGDHSEIPPPDRI